MTVTRTITIAPDHSDTYRRLLQAYGFRFSERALNSGTQLRIKTRATTDKLNLVLDEARSACEETP